MTQKVATIRTLERADGFYVIEYRYARSCASVPMTYPPGQPHYPAEITVFRVINGSGQKIGKSFRGQYTDLGCFEDDPKMLVEYAIKHKDDRQEHK